MPTEMSRSIQLKEKGTVDMNSIQGKVIAMKQLVILPLEMVEVRGLMRIKGHSK